MLALSDGERDAAKRFYGLRGRGGVAEAYVVELDDGRAVHRMLSDGRQKLQRASAGALRCGCARACARLGSRGVYALLGAQDVRAGGQQHLAGNHVDDHLKGVEG